MLTAPLYRAPHPAHSSSSPDTTISDDHKHSQSPTLIPSTSTLSLSASPNSSSPIPTPGVSSDDASTNEARWDVMAETFGNSQDPLNMFMSQEIGYGQGEPDYERAMSFSQDSAEDKSYMEAEVEVQSTHQPLRRLSRSRSRSRSTDQLQLFTSPHDSKLKYVYSPIAIPASPLCVTVPDNPRTPSQDYTLLSPHHSLTTPNLSSKLVTVTTRSQSPVSPENKTSPLTPSSSPPQQPYAEGDEDLARQFVEDQESRRYSMRARRPQQLNPYVYDKLLYKRQMKSNPDAIVKFASPKRRNHSHGGDGEDLMTQDGETQDWNMDVDGDDEDASWVDKHQRRSQKERPRNGDAEVPLESQDASGDLPSSDEDPDIKEMLKEAKKIKERARLKERGKLKEKEQEEREREKRWRLKPFPLRREKGKMKHKEFTAKQHDQEIEGVPGIVPPSPVCDIIDYSYSVIEHIASLSHYSSCHDSPMICVRHGWKHQNLLQSPSNLLLVMLNSLHTIITTILPMRTMIGLAMRNSVVRISSTSLRCSSRNLIRRMTLQKFNHIRATQMLAIQILIQALKK